VPDAVLTPFAAQPGQMLAPEDCAVALRAEGAHGTSLAVWRPGGRRVLWLTGPDGWLPGAGLWTAGGVLRLPYACVHCACGVVSYKASAEPFPSPQPLGQERQSGNRVLPLRHAPLDHG
jgi:hypothetical protein